MENPACPNCGAEMKKEKSEDVTTDVCVQCGGVFLDKGELNALATGMAGDIEYCSIDSDFHKDRFDERICPKCPQQPMKKINLLGQSDIIFDYCPNCEGFFLDKAELGRINQELRRLSPNKEAEEYRRKHGDHLVRIDLIGDTVEVGYLGISRAANEHYIRVSVFFNREMPELRVFEETWPVRLAKRIGLFTGRDIKTGDEKFDAAFRVQGHDEAAVAAHLDAAARKALLDFRDNEPDICGRSGSLHVGPSGVVYVEGPYIPGTCTDIVEKAKPLFEVLVDIASRIEAVPQA